MTSYKELLKQRDALEQQIHEARKREIADAVATVRATIQEYGLTQGDVFPAGRARSTSAAKGNKVAAKYRDPATGETWVGRGATPKWMRAYIEAGRNKDEFLI